MLPWSIRMRFGVFSTVFVVDLLRSFDLLLWVASVATGWIEVDKPVLALSGRDTCEGGRCADSMNWPYFWA